MARHTVESLAAEVEAIKTALSDHGIFTSGHSAKSDDEEDSETEE